MNRGKVAAGLCLVAALIATVPARASAGCDRQCKIEAANKYLAALVSHDASDVPFADDAWRQENGGQKAEGAETIRSATESPIMYVITGIHDLRWYVQGDEAVAIYYLDTVAPTYIFERFNVRDDGLIHEIEAHYYIDTAGHVSGPESVTSHPDARRQALLESNHGPFGPVPVNAGNTGDDAARPPSACGDQCVVDAVSTFLDAMATGDASGVPLADSATETINHRPIADIAGNLATSAGAIDTVDQRLVYVDGNQGTALYQIELAGGGTYFGAARFATDNGRVTEIEAVCNGAELCS